MNLAARSTPIPTTRYTVCQCTKCNNVTIANTQSSRTLRGWAEVGEELTTGICPACAKRLGLTGKVLPKETQQKRRRPLRTEARKVTIEAAIGWWLTAYDAPPTYPQLVEVTGFTRAQVRQSISDLVKDGSLVWTDHGLHSARYRLVVKVEPWRIREFARNAPLVEVTR